MGARLFTLASSLVLLGCLGLLGSVAGSLASVERGGALAPRGPAAPQEAGAPPQAGVSPSRDLTRHLPLAGMPDAAPGDTDACRRLEGYVVDAVHELRERGAKPPFAPELLKTALDEERCAVDAPEVAEILRHLGAAYGQAGLPVSEPMLATD